MRKISQSGAPYFCAFISLSLSLSPFALICPLAVAERSFPADHNFLVEFYFVLRT